MPKAADITNISYGHEHISWEMSVYFDNIGLVPQLFEKLVLSLCGVKNARPLAEATWRLHFSKTRVFRPLMV